MSRYSSDDLDWVAGLFGEIAERKGWHQADEVLQTLAKARSRIVREMNARHKGPRPEADHFCGAAGCCSEAVEVLDFFGFCVCLCAEHATQAGESAYRRVKEG